MITYEEYVAKHKDSPDLTEAIKGNIENLLLPKVNRLLIYMKDWGVALHVNPSTKSFISGVDFGGFRPQYCPIGAPKSNHKKGLAVDIYDPYNQLDLWCMNNHAILEELGLWLEHPSSTKGWCHVQAVPPRSNNRVFLP